MKKIATLLMMSILVIFTSCDEDEVKSRYLSGEWTGKMGMYYTYEYLDGYVESFNAAYTDIVFYPEREYATYGWGKEVDYYNYGPCIKQYYYFDWEVRNGIIYLDYPSDPSLSVAITDYRINNDRFKGYLGNVKFSLHKLVDFYGWDEYSGYYYYYDRPGWNPYYYAKSRDGKVDQSRTEEFDPERVRKGCRFMEAN